MDGTRVPITPLQVEIDGIGSYQTAKTVEDLAACLLGGRWNGRKGARFHRAVVASIEALEFYVDADTARAAFVDAAHVAGMHVLPDDLVEMKKAG
jgi:hypothetical protein